MERVEESGRDKRLGPYKRGRLNKHTLTDSREAESSQMGGDREAIIEANPKVCVVKILVDDDYVERICRVDSNICHHVNANMFLPVA